MYFFLLFLSANISLSGGSSLQLADTAIFKQGKEARGGKIDFLLSHDGWFCLQKSLSPSLAADW